MIKETKKIFFLSLLLCFFASCFFSYCYGHEDDVELKVEFKRVELNEEAIQTLGIKTQEVKEEVTDEVVKTTGQIEEIPKYRFDINSPVQGKVTSVLVDLGDLVKVGQPLAALQSTDISKLQSEVNQFSAELELAKSTYEREKLLFEKGISAKKDFDAAKTYLASAETKLKAAQSNLRILTEHATSSDQGTFTIKSQKTGIIVERNITIGQVINPNQMLFRGVDLTNVWASADIYEKDSNKVSLEQNVYVILDGNPDKKYVGKLTYVGHIINKETRTLPVKATLQNYEGTIHELPLRPGAFIQMEIHTGEKKKTIIIPRTSLVEIDKEGTEGKHHHIVYVKKDRNQKDKKLFLPRKIEVEKHDSNNVEVLSGLMVGEIIVTQGAYQLQYADIKDKNHEVKFSQIQMLLGLSVILLVVFLIFSFLKKSRTMLL